jgi:hypothetical protein
MPARFCRCLGLWCGVSLAWIVAVLGFLALRIRDQIAASEALARDIAALDGAGSGGALVTSWEDMTALILEYRAALVFEVALLPPLALLAAALLYLALRRAAPRPLLRPGYSAAVRRALPSRFM